MDGDNNIALCFPPKGLEQLSAGAVASGLQRSSLRHQLSICRRRRWVAPRSSRRLKRWALVAWCFPLWITIAVPAGDDIPHLRDSPKELSPSFELRSLWATPVWAAWWSKKSLTVASCRFEARNQALGSW